MTEVTIVRDNSQLENESIEFNIDTHFNEIFEFLDEDENYPTLGRKNLRKAKVIWDRNLELKYNYSKHSLIECRYIASKKIKGKEIGRHKNFLMSFPFVLAVIIYPEQGGIGCLYDFPKLRSYVNKCNLEMFAGYYNYELGFGFNSAKGHDWMGIGILSMCDRPTSPAAPAKVKATKCIGRFTPKSEITVYKIFEWIQILKSEGKIILQKDIAAETKMAIRTVRNYWPHFKAYVAWHNNNLAI